MKRRKFIQSGLAVPAAVAGATQVLGAMNPTAKRSFKLKYGPHIGMFAKNAGEDPIAQLQFMADQGFTAFEDNGMKDRTPELQKKMGDTMTKLGIQMGVFVAHKIYWTAPNLTNGNADLRKEFLQHIRESVEVAKRSNAKWMTVVPGFVDLKLNPGFQTANVIESLKQASAILEPHGLVMVLEALNFRDHPGLFLTNAPQAYSICKAVNSPSCKILFDIYHEQIQEGNIIPNLDAAWEEIAYIQIGDNPGRKEPTTGEINYKNVFKHVHGKGYQGVLGMEHGNSKPDKEGEMAVIKAYEEVDNF